MSLLQDRRFLAGAGAVVAVALAVGAAIFLSRTPRAPGPDAVTESSNITASDAGGLKVVMGKSPKLEADTSVRCFVNGQFVGMQTASDCASKNGVAPGQLDVGLDQSGAIAASAAGAHLQPLANAIGDSGGADAADDSQSSDSTASDDGDYASAPPADCRRYAAGGWRPAGSDVSLDACVHTLFDGRCPPPGQVVYGHWGTLTLRASPGRIDVSPDNRDFHALAPQYPADCSIPPL